MSASTFECSVRHPPQGFFLSRPSTFSLSFHKLRVSALIHRQQKCKSASCPRLALHPYLPAMRLDEPLRNNQPQTHSPSRPFHADKILKNFLVMLHPDP